MAIAQNHAVEPMIYHNFQDSKIIPFCEHLFGVLWLMLTVWPQIKTAASDANDRDVNTAAREVTDDGHIFKFAL